MAVSEVLSEYITEGDAQKKKKKGEAEPENKKLKEGSENVPPSTAGTMKKKQRKPASKKVWFNLYG